MTLAVEIAGDVNLSVRVAAEYDELYVLYNEFVMLPCIGRPWYGSSPTLHRKREAAGPEKLRDIIYEPAAQALWRKLLPCTSTS